MRQRRTDTKSEAYVRELMGAGVRLEGNEKEHFDFRIAKT